jgi:hypothetical protein
MFSTFLVTGMDQWWLCHQDWCQKHALKTSCGVRQQ